MESIQSLWVKGELSDMEHYSIHSFLKKGHSYHLYVYDHVDNVPKGTVIKDAEKIIPADRIFTYKKHGSYAGFANLFRYKLLYDYGGLWVDTDFLCIKPFVFKSTYLFCGDKKYNKDRWGRYLNYVNNCLIKAPAGSPIMKNCYDFANQADDSTLDWGETGPRLLNYRVEKYDMKRYVSPVSWFCPIHWWQWNIFLNASTLRKWGTKTRFLFNTYAVHLWNEQWRRKGEDKTYQPTKGRLYDEIIRSYC